MKQTKRGFTLIELLVVIAIIGILSSIVLASLNSARTKGNDAKIKEQLSSFRSAAEIYNSTNGSYSTTSVNLCTVTGLTSSSGCVTGIFSDVPSGITNILNYNNWPSGTVVIGNAASTGYALQSALSTAGTYWCVDSTGQSKSESAVILTGALACL